MFDHDTTGVNESGDFTPIPEGTYIFNIGPTAVSKSRNGDPVVKVELTVSDGKYEGKRVFHYVTFLPKNNAGAGISKRWLHAINEKYEGNVTVNPQQWNGIVKCDIKIEEYPRKDGTPGKSNKVTAVHLPDTMASEKAETAKNTEDVPF